MSVDPITVWYSLVNAGDGSAYPEWYLTEQEARTAQEDEEWGEPCLDSVETFVGSEIHTRAIAASGQTWITIGAHRIVVTKETEVSAGCIELHLHTDMPPLVSGGDLILHGWDGQQPIVWSWGNTECKVI